MDKTVLTRAELHSLVWAKPLRSVARELGISDVGLSKMCKRHGVPTPPQGHWTRVQMGKPVTKGALPPAKADQAERVEIIGGRARSKAEPANHPTMPPEELSRRQKLLERETQLEPPVARQEPAKLHPIAARVQKALKGEKPDDYGCVRCTDPSLPNVRVTPDSIPRAVAIVDALARGAEGRRLPWKSGSRGKWHSVASLVVEGVEFPIEVYETVERRPHELTAEERARKARGQYYWARTYDYFGADRFSIRRSEWNQYLKDTKRQRVEDRIGELFSILIHRAFETRERERQQRIEEDRVARRAAWHAEIKRLQGIEKSSLERLHTHVADWRKAQDLGSLIEAIRALDLPASESRARWLDWAQAYADSIDPLKCGLERVLDVQFDAFDELQRMRDEGVPD